MNLTRLKALDVGMVLRKAQAAGYRPGLSGQVRSETELLALAEQITKRTIDPAVAAALLLAVPEQLQHSVSVRIDSAVELLAEILAPQVQVIQPTGSLGLWLKADTGITLVGGEVDGWADQSGYLRHFYASSSGSRPLYETVGGKNIVRTSSAGRFLISDNRNLFRGLESFYVIARVQRPASAGPGGLLYDSLNSTPLGLKLLLDSYNSSTRWRWHIRAPEQNPNGFRQLQGVTTNGMHVMVAGAELASNRLFIREGMSIVADTTYDPSLLAAPMQDLDSQQLTMGTNGGTNYASFNIQEIRVYTQAMTSGEIDAVVNEMNAYWS